MALAAPADASPLAARSAVALERPLFEASPAEVWIDDYAPFQAVRVRLAFRNRDAVARRLTIEPVRSPFFRVSPCARAPGGIDGKVAAGMEVAFALEFAPQQVDDYAVDLVCRTERETFLLPVRARGRFAALDIPDQIAFGLCPVRLASTKALTVRNVGTRGAKFAFKPSDPDVFAVAPHNAELQVGQAVQIELTFRPPSRAVTQGTLEVIDDSGTTAVVELLGDVENVDVYLNQPLVEPSAAYLSLSSRKTIKICNESEFTLDFSWKSFADSAGDEQERDRLLDQLARMEALELEQLRQDELDGEQSVPLSPSPFDAHKTLEMKYKHLRKAAMEDSMQFVDDCFTVTPLKGRVWAHSEIDVVVSFTPQTELLYSSTAFLDVAGQEHRLPLQIRGQGIGPKAKVVYNELLDFGDVFISDERTRDFTIQNKGEISAKFQLVPMDIPPGYSMQIFPECGTLEVNEMRKIEVTFTSQELGEVAQTIRFNLQGSSDQLIVRFKAAVIPPVFHFDTDLVDFGQVSYSFPQTRTVKLINASKIAMKYSLRIPEEASYKHKEMLITPSQGKLSAYGEEEIVINFTPMHVKVYEYQLVVGVTGVGTDLLSVPLRAQSLVPDLTIDHPDLDFGHCFLRYPHKQTLVIENCSPNLFGRYEIGEQDDHSKAIAMYDASEFSGVVQPGEKVQVELSLSCEKIGNIRLPMVINIPGSADLPLAVTLTATGCGPKVELDQPEVHWGNCTCLIGHERVLRMTNSSLIPAEFKTLIKNARSKFQVDKKEGVLMPGESTDLVVTANLDDTVLFKDQLYILIAEGETLVVPLSIKGTGTTMWSPSELRVIDFGPQMTHRVCEWSCTLENKGKRVQVLSWVNKTAVANRDRAGGVDSSGITKKLTRSNQSGSKRQGGSPDQTSASEEVVPVFSVFPGSIELKPRTACVFMFKGLSTAAGVIQEDLVCETRVGKEKVSKVAFVTQIRALFVNPKLEPSALSLAFEYVHTPGTEIARQSQPLSLTNVCELPLSFTLRTQTPFSLDCWEATLQPQERVDFNVEFYPGYKEDYTCRVINGKVIIVYTEHPQKDSVELVGDISFPNLTFETTKIDFGCTLNDTQKAISMVITNISKVDTSFQWVFVDDDKEGQLSKKQSIPINQVFDILPIRGLLKPSESEKVEFIYYGHANRKFRSLVACEVEGGPEYEITLQGEASSMVYRLDKQSLDFGQVLFNKLEDRDFSILNVGKVPFSFCITVDRISLGRFVEVTPTAGKIAPGEKARIIVRLRPGIPEQFEETIVLEIAHFQPFDFKIYGYGAFSSVSCNLPRENHPSCTVDGVAPNWGDLKKQARKMIKNSGLKPSDVESAALGAGSPLKWTGSKTSLPRSGEKGNSTVSLPATPVGKTDVSPSSCGSPPASPARRGAGGSTSAVDEVDIETEACRLFFSEYLVMQETKKAESSSRKASVVGIIEDEFDPRFQQAPELAKTNSNGNVESVVPGAKTKPLRKRGEPRALGFVLSQFVLDFGHIVMGTHKVKKFNITNVGHVPVSFQLDKNLASSRGFQIEPERVVRLPEKQSVEFAVTFQARKNIDMGFYNVQLPVAVKNGPPSLLTMRATVTVPDISISADNIDFGKVAVGRCHTVFTQLQNVSAVVAEWAFKKPMGSTRDVGNFRFSPQSGVLTPGNKVNVRIEFVPDDGRHFILKLPIKVASNPKSRSIVCRGEGSELRLEFRPQIVDLGPVLPCDPPAQQMVTFLNNSDYPVEVFSLDFDPVYKEDEMLLRSLSAYNPEGILQLPVHTPGQSLKSYIMENGLLPIDSYESPQLENADIEIEDVAGTFPGTTQMEENADSLLHISSERPRLPTAVDFVIMGPPQCGKSTQARLLAEKENLCVWSIDDAIRLACVSDSELGKAARTALGLQDGQTIPQDQSQKSASTLVGISSTNSLTKTTESAQSNEPEIEGESASVTHIDELLPLIVSWRLAQGDMQRGSVLDGFDSLFVPSEKALEACIASMADARVVLLTFDEDSYDAMLAVTSGTNCLAVVSSNNRLSPHSHSKESLESTSSHQSLQLGDNQHTVEDAVQDSIVGEETTVNGALGCDNSVGSADSAASQPLDESALRGRFMQDQFSSLVAFKQASLTDSSTTLGDYLMVLKHQRHRLEAFYKQANSKVPIIIPDEEDSRPEKIETENTTGILQAGKGVFIEISLSDIGEPLFIHGVMFAAIEKHLRELESQNLSVPDPATYQLIRRPPERFPRKPISSFSIVIRPKPQPCTTLDEPTTEVDNNVASPNLSRPPSAAVTRSRPSTAGNRTEENSPAPADQSTEESEVAISTVPSYRCVIAPHSNVDIQIQFASSETGVFDCSLGFEIVGGGRREFTLFGRGTCSVPTVNSDPRSVFMSRIKSRPEGAFVQKKFVMSLGQFEFGPLIVASNPALRVPQTERDFEEWRKTSPSNIEVLRLSNNCRFPLHLDVGMAGAPESNGFLVAPSSLDVREGETGEVMVWASPSSNGLHESALVVCVKDNPEPVVFPVTCYGCMPKLELRGPWEQPAATSTSEAESSEDAKLSSRSDARENKLLVLDFEKLLLKHQEDKTFFIENVSPVSVTWRARADEIPADFRLFPLEGVVKPLQKAPVLVGFHATIEAVHNFELQIEYSDTESALAIEDRRRSISLMVAGEAYKIDVCSFEETVSESASRSENGDGRLDFGLVRVGEKHVRSFTIRNRGKYNIKHVLSCRTASSREYFSIEPTELILEPDQVSTVHVTFQSKREVVLHECKDIKCVIVEMISGDPCKEFYIYTSGHAVFSKFRLQPNRGINFGPNRFNDQAKSKRVEIRNDGDFPFRFRVAPSSIKLVEELTIDTQLRPSSLTVGQFTIMPDFGTVDPGALVALDVTFQPKDCAVYCETVQIDISGRRVDEQGSETLLYELIGESCYPGINSSDLDSIFEEQIVVRSMDLNTTQPGAIRGNSIPLGVFAEKENVFSFGAIIAAASSKGSVERFKISNPTKITSVLHFQIISKQNGDTLTPRNSADQQVFTVQPSMWEIPPLEYRFVSAYFRPPAIATYHATFCATVDDSPTSESSGPALQFELRGEGTLPCVTILEPSQREHNGMLQLNYGRVRVSKSKDMSLVLRNDGILSATVLFSIQSNPNFLFALENGSVVLPPRATETLVLQFRPLKVHDEPVSVLLKVSVQNNQFEESTIKLSGAGYREDLALEDLPGAHEDDELHFNDVHLRVRNETDIQLEAVKDTQVFSLWNQTDDMLRFEFPKDRPFSFHPSVGHLPPRGHKMITASFEPGFEQEPRAIIYQSHPVTIHYQRIAFKASATALPLHDWDDSVQTVSFGDDGAHESSSIKSNVAEPEYTQLAPLSTLAMSCFAAADFPSFEADTTSILFRRTFMLQMCAHKIKVQNKSKICLPFSWRWEHPTAYSQDNLFAVVSLGGSSSLDSDCPFEIDPLDGVIPPEQAQEFVVKFAPMEVDDFHHVLLFESPATTSSVLQIDVRGTSLRPACHFDVEQSDYPQRRAPTLPGPFGELGALDPSIKVIEMESLGVKVRNTRRFYVVNPTNVSYEFSWVPQGENNSCFRCSTPKGLMLAGKRCEMIFEFTPQHLELQEMFWYFRIPHFDVNQLFLLVGSTVEPRVTMDRGSVNFNTLLIGTKATQSVALINHEHIPFNFVLDKSSLDFAGETPALIVHPLSGVIPPNSRTMIEIEFIPTEEKAYNFNIICIVKRKPTRLSLNVKGEGYSIHDALAIASDDQSESQLVVLGSPTVLDFGLIRVNEEVQRTIVIHNNGKFNFEFNWSFPRQPMAVSIEPMQGTIKKNDRAACRIGFVPTKQVSLDGWQLNCTIAGSKSYNFVLQGSAVPPSLQFSFTSHDFGPCFVTDPGAEIEPEAVTLTVTNMDPEAGIDFDCLFEKKPHLHVDCHPTTLGPRESINIPIVFIARQELNYLEVVPFIVNGSTTISVSIRGEGTLPRVELVNTSMQTVSLGNLQIGQQISRAVKIANRSKRKSTVRLEVSDQPGVPSLESLGILVLPQREILLRTKESVDVEFRFAPTERIPAFQKDIFLNIAGCRKKLLTLSGSCQGVEVALEVDTLSFGAVCIGSQLVRKVRLQNRGDVPCKFRWSLQQFAPDFWITPSEGIVAANHHKTFEVTFKPAAVNPDVRYEKLPCAVDGTNPVVLTLVGACVDQTPSSIQDINFNSRVRESMTKSVTIENKTATAWNLLPVVQGEHWSCQENITVAANSSASLAVVYLPLRMTQQGSDDVVDSSRPEIHEGSIFLAIPDGTALLYKVFGKAGPPVVADHLTLTAPAKKILTVSIPVKNWLRVAQTFHVDINKSDANESTTIQGAASVSLPGTASKNYTAKFFSYMEGKSHFSIRLTNQETGEYIVYELAVTATKAAEVETLHFNAPVRQSVKKVVTIENPFNPDRAVHFVDPSEWWKCSNPCIRVKQLSELTGRREGSYEVEYRPILHSLAPVEDQLTISFAELGDFTYKLVLTTQPASTERTLQFTAPLGASKTQMFEFVSFVGHTGELSAAVGNAGSFTIPATCKVDAATEWEGKTFSIPIKFEPEAIGEVRDMLVLQSDTVGEYKCSLHGIATAPLPQGPFVFNGSVDIEFKNVFSTPSEFEVVSDSPYFVVSTRTMSIPPKSAKTISVKVDPSAVMPARGKTSSGPMAGKLLVSCPSMKALPPWVYYLESQAPPM